jgi:hypothetical protein
MDNGSRLSRLPILYRVRVPVPVSSRSCRCSARRVAAGVACGWWKIARCLRPSSDGRALLNTRKTLVTQSRNLFIITYQPANRCTCRYERAVVYSVLGRKVDDTMSLNGVHAISYFRISVFPIASEIEPDIIKYSQNRWNRNRFRSFPDLDLQLQIISIKLAGQRILCTRVGVTRALVDFYS